MWGRMALVAAGVVVAAWASVHTGAYLWSLFVIVPFAAGLATDQLCRFGSPWTSALAAAAVLGIAGCAMLALRFEGLICLVMALPLAFPLAALGALVSHWVRAVGPESARLPLVLALLAAPAGLTAERMWTPVAPLFAVSTAVEIDAPPAVVWRHVVSFSELPAEREWLFRLGIAYPKRAVIRGRGVGAIRECVFSTGPFVEPIEVWDEPRLLKFSVTSNPAPMEEWTPYGGGLDAPHLHGYLTSQGGQFRLTPDAGGQRTRLEGTTWYRHRMEPAGYWRLWSDFIIHRIHMRVLRHVKRLSEQQHNRE